MDWPFADTVGFATRILFKSLPPTIYVAALGTIFRATCVTWRLARLTIATFLLAGDACCMKCLFECIAGQVGNANTRQRKNIGCSVRGTASRGTGKSKARSLYRFARLNIEVAIGIGERNHRCSDDSFACPFALDDLTIASYGT